MHGNLIRAAAMAFFGLCLALPALAAEPMTLKQYMALSGPAPTEHIAYGSASQQYVEWFAPVGSGPFPVAVLIHGGCFLNELEGMVQFRGMASALAARGIAVWSVEYRGVDTAGGGYPGTFLDVRSALDLLASQAPSRHLDLDRLVLVGHSAGGMLALWSAGRSKLPTTSPLYEPHPLPIHKVVALGASGDFQSSTAELLKAKCQIDPAQLVGSPSAERPNVFADTSPLDLTPNGSETWFVNGDHDTIVTPKESATYAARVRTRGDATETLLLPNASHFDEVATNSPSWMRVKTVILQTLGIH